MLDRVEAANQPSAAAIGRKAELRKPQLNKLAKYGP
jgi:hypothetical protein